MEPSPPFSSEITPEAVANADGSRETIRQHLLAALQGIAARLLRHREERTDLEEASAQIQRTLALLSPDQARSDKGAISEASLHVFAKILRERREAAGMSREKLAERARVAVATLRGIEKAQHAPSRTTMVRLLSVPELRMQAGEATPEDPDFRLHSWFAPRYDPVQMMVDFIETLNGPGGQVEQTYQYLDSQSAIHWLAVCNATPYATAYRATMPLEKAAERIAKLAGGLGIDVNALGCGDGKQEVRLVQHILDLAKKPGQVRLNLLDISHALLSTAFRHAQDVLDTRPVQICMLHGNFHDLPKYRQLNQQPEGERRCRVFALFGNTLANLDNEARFFRDTLVGCVPGDLFLLNVATASAPADDPEQVRKTDPAFKGISSAHQEWLTGPIRRYCRDVVEIKLWIDLDTNCPIPGSYETAARVLVTAANREDRRFTMWRVRRYDIQKLTDCLEQLGWECLMSQTYGPSGTKPAVLMLLRKR